MPATAVMAHCQSPSPGVTLGNHFLGKNLKNGYFEKSSENKKHKKMSAIFYPVSSEFHHIVTPAIPGAGVSSRLCDTLCQPTCGCVTLLMGYFLALYPSH